MTEAARSGSPGSGEGRGRADRERGWLEGSRCPVCLERFVDPRLVGGCGHSVCGRCAERLVLLHAAGRRLLCPSCRQEARLPPPGRHLPRNFELSKLLGSMSALGLAGSPSPPLSAEARSEARSDGPSEPGGLVQRCGDCGSLEDQERLWRCPLDAAEVCGACLQRLHRHSVGRPTISVPDFDQRHFLLQDAAHRAKELLRDLTGQTPDRPDPSGASPWTSDPPMPGFFYQVLELGFLCSLDLLWAELSEGSLGAEELDAAVERLEAVVGGWAKRAGAWEGTGPGCWEALAGLAESLPSVRLVGRGRLGLWAWLELEVGDVGRLASPSGLLRARVRWRRRLGLCPSTQGLTKLLPALHHKTLRISPRPRPEHSPPNVQLKGFRQADRF